MESYARNFVKISVISLLLGMILGLGMADSALMMKYRSVHVHLLLIGFMSMMIFGVAYHLIPRFQGHAIIPWAWATLHFWLATIGLVLMLGGWVLRVNGLEPEWILTLGGGMEFVGVVIFLIVMFRGLKPLREAR
jgi:hypothetical protein